MYASLAAPWKAAIEEAWAAFCQGSLPIGAALADSAGIVFARGRNSLFDRSHPHQPLQQKHLAHAELNALLKLGPEAPQPQELYLYTTLEPCAMCTGAIIVAGIPNTRYLLPDPQGGYADLFTTNPRTTNRFSVFRSEPDALAQALMALVVAALLDKGMPLPDDSALATLLPEHLRGVALGKKLAASGEIKQAARQRLRASVVITDLVQRVG